MTMESQIERARPEDLEAVLNLLVQQKLPPEGLEEHFETTFVARHAGQIVGSAALEMHADGALLRSVAVAPEQQGRGLGRQLTDTAIRFAQEHGAPALYLLTTTAAEYFPKAGFERIERDAVPRGVQTSVEFTSACPSNATVMRKRL